MSHKKTYSVGHYCNPNSEQRKAHTVTVLPLLSITLFVLIAWILLAAASAVKDVAPHFDEAVRAAVRTK